MKSKAAIVLISLFALTAIFSAQKWKRYEVLVWDVSGYYAYLPSHYITNDVGDLSYVAGIREKYRPDMDGDYAFVKLPNGRTVTKYPIGMALFYFPGFWLAHGYALLTGQEADGYARPYQQAVVLVCFAYIMIGLCFLRALLRQYYSDSTTAIVLLTIGLATNLFCYMTYDAPMTHGTLFALQTAALWLAIHWYRTYQAHYAFYLGLVLGLAILVRPSEALMVLVPILWGLTSWQALQQRMSSVMLYWQQWGLMLITMTSVASLQLLYWRVVTDNWTINFYPNETFDFAHPHIMGGLFGSDKGWFIYSPALLFAVFGLWPLRRYTISALPPLLIVLPVVVYVTFSWHDWRYGGGFGARPLISTYGLLSLPVASVLETARTSVWRWRIQVGLLVFFMGFSMLQTWQLYKNLLDCCRTSWPEYWNRLFLLHW